MIDPAELSLVDFLTLLLVFVTTRSGFLSGFAESVWSMLRWSIVLAAGTLTSPALGASLSAATELSAGFSAVVCYLIVGLTTLGILGLLQRRFGARVLLAIPTGRVDGLFGLLAGLVAGTAGSLVVYALLNPFDSGTIDWSPMGMQNQEALGGLTRAVAGTVRHAVLDGSWCGRMLQEHFGGLLVGGA